MTVMASPRSKKCNDRALQIVRAEKLSELRSYKAERKLGSRALRALGRTAELWVATAYCLMLLTLSAIALGLMGAGLAIGFEIGKAIYRWIVG